MTNVLVCIKRVPDSSSDVLLTEDAQAVDGRYVGFTVAPHENCAVELAVQIAGATGGEATVVTLGSEEAAEQLRGVLALGCTAAAHIVSRSAAFARASACALVPAYCSE